jgi:hypothetical protein
MQGPNNSWKIRFVSFTGHGFISFPGKEALLVIPLHNGIEDYEYRFINVE